jgi:hypothetical protein
MHPELDPKLVAMRVADLRAAMSPPPRRRRRSLRRRAARA